MVIDMNMHELNGKCIFSAVFFLPFSLKHLQTNKSNLNTILLFEPVQNKHGDKLIIVKMELLNEMKSFKS